MAKKGMGRRQRGRAWSCRELLGQARCRIIPVATPGHCAGMGGREGTAVVEESFPGLVNLRVDCLVLMLLMRKKVGSRNIFLVSFF